MNRLVAEFLEDDGLTKRHKLEKGELLNSITMDILMTLMTGLLYFNIKLNSLTLWHVLKLHAIQYCSYTTKRTGYPIYPLETTQSIKK